MNIEEIINKFMEFLSTHGVDYGIRVVSAPFPQRDVHVFEEKK